MNTHNSRKLHSLVIFRNILKDETIKKITQALNIDIRELFDFAHIHSKKELLQKIENFLLNAKIEDLEFLYRVIISYIESQKNK